LITQTLELLEKKEDVLLKKVNAEKEKAIEFIRGKNKRGRLVADQSPSTYVWGACDLNFCLMQGQRNV